MITREEIENWIADKEENAFGPLSYHDGANELLAILWPIVDAYQKRSLDPKRGLYADEMALFNKLKRDLGLPIMEWEKV